MSAARKKLKRPLTTVDIQLELIVCAFREKGIAIGVARTGKDGPDGEGGLDFLYQKGVILVRDAYLSQVARLVGGGEALDGLTDGVTLFSLAKAKKTRRAVVAADADEVLAKKTVP
jgi:hypothetical protein